MKNQLGHKIFSMAKTHFALQGLELFDDGEIWNNLTGKKVADLTDYKIEDRDVHITIVPIKAIEYININIDISMDEDE